MSIPYIQEQVSSYGTGVLSDAQTLSVFLTGTKERSATERATGLIQQYGSIVAICHSLQHNINAIPEISTRQALQLVAGREIAVRCLKNTLNGGDVLSSPDHVRQYLSLHLTGLQHEVFAGLFLDNRHRVVEYRELFSGTIDSAAVYPREIVKRCLASNAAAVIFAHNHPSGVAEPSDTDIRLTRRLIDALALIDVRVLDHLIAGQGCMTSLAERGLM